MQSLARAFAPAAFALILAVAVNAADSVALPAGGTVRYSTVNAKTRLEIRTPAGRRASLSVQRDATVAAQASPTVKVIGEIDGSAIILLDTYPSIPGGMSYCQAGEEQFLRIISLAKHPPAETLRVKTGSCRENIELQSPGIEWQPESSTLRITWLQGPKGGHPEVRVLHIGTDGTPQPQSPQS